jgi:hypothetical protein
MTVALRRTVFLDGARRPDDYEVRMTAEPSAAFTASQHRPGAVATDTERARATVARPEWRCGGYARRGQGGRSGRRGSSALESTVRQPRAFVSVRFSEGRAEVR